MSGTNYLKNILIEKNLKQCDIVKNVYPHKSIVSRWIKKDTTISIPFLLKLCKYLEINEIDYLQYIIEFHKNKLSSELEKIKPYSQK